MADENHLNQWVVSQLEPEGIADLPVLASYVCTLAQNRQEPEEMRADMLAKLEVFLQSSMSATLLIVPNH